MSEKKKEVKKKMWALVWEKKEAEEYGDFLMDTFKNHENYFIFEDLVSKNEGTKATADIALFLTRREATKAKEGIRGFRVIPVDVHLKFQIDI